MLESLGYIVVGLALLIFGGDFLLKASVAFSLKLQIPKVVIGMTIVSFATSAPELIVSINSALDGYPDLALGNVVGSNIANIGLVLGATVLLGSIQVEKSFYNTDWPMMMFSSVLLYFFLLGDSTIERYEGFILFALLIPFLFYILKFKKGDKEDIPDEEGKISLLKSSIYLILGGLALWGGSELLVNGAVDLATKLNVDQRVIGITVVSIGTSIPELAASIIAIIKKEKSISMGNLLGSNIFNIMAVLGITSMILPVKAMNESFLSSDIFWMLGIAFVTLPLALFFHKSTFSWKKGIILLALYLTFIYVTVF